MAENNISPGTGTDEDFQLWRLLDHTRFMIARSREMELAQFGLTPEQAYLLDILHQNDGSTTINEIVTVTLRQHHSISTQINRMAKQGLVNKVQYPSDRRKYSIVLTEKGQTLFKEVTRDSIRMTFACLSDEDKAELGLRLTLLNERAYSMLSPSEKEEEKS